MNDGYIVIIYFSFGFFFNGISMESICFLFSIDFRVYFRSDKVAWSRSAKCVRSEKINKTDPLVFKYNIHIYI